MANIGYVGSKNLGYCMSFITKLRFIYQSSLKQTHLFLLKFLILPTPLQNFENLNPILRAHFL